MSISRFHFSFLLCLAGQLALAALPARADTATIAAGQTVTLSLTATGTAPFSYQWFKDGRAVTGATAATHVIKGFKATDAGTYSATMTNAGGWSSSDNGTLVLAAAPVFTTQPAGATIFTGGDVTFTAAASSTPAPAYQWRKNGVVIAGATAASYTVAKATLTSAGTYSVVATNAAGTATSNGAVLSVTTPMSAPAFTTQPVSQTVLAGNAVTFAVVASGTPAPAYQWRKDGTAITGATGSSYTITGVTTASAGAYSVVVSNFAGIVVSNNAVLTVTLPATPPVFTTHPAGKAVAVGGAVTFTAAASGTPSPVYQWRKDGAAIAGATGSSLTITGITTASAGTYSVVATNSAGTAASAGAVLSVAPLVRSDFNGDGKSDILWQNILTGQHRVWLMAGTTLASAVAVSGTTVDWDIAGTGDFNADGQPDILWQNLVTREASIWFMTGTGIGGYASLGVPALGMYLAGTGDFNGDGKTDVIWQNTLTREYSIVLMNGTVAGTSVSLGTVDAAWSVAGTGDFNGDGKTDILWENATGRQAGLWLMNGTAYASWVGLGSFTAGWRMGGTGDFNGDGKPDILWQNTLTGESRIRLMSGVTSGAEISLGVSPVEWQMAN